MEELFPAIHRYALENRVPVIDSDALNVVKQYIQIKVQKHT